MPTEQYCDIAVVGGGPAGLSSAYSAAKTAAANFAHSRVMLFEKDESIAHNIRTSGVTWIDEINKLGIGPEYYNPIKNYCFVSPSNEITLSGDRAAACVLNVRSTYQHLAFLAAQAGAEIMIRSNIFRATTNSNGRIVGLNASTPTGDII